MENIFHRVSIRKYEDKPVEKEKILQILKAGPARFTPKPSAPGELNARVAGEL